MAGKSDVVHCFFSCSTVDDDDGGTCLIVRLGPSGPKECALRGEYDINSERNSVSAARLPMVALVALVSGQGHLSAALGRQSACGEDTHAARVQQEFERTGSRVE